MKIKIGILGCAGIAQRSVIPAIKACSNYFNLVAVASRTSQKAEQYSNEFGCDAVTGYGRLIARDDVDAVYIPLPTGLHDEWVMAALEAGKHVYVEKSLAFSSASAKSICNLAEKNGLSLMEGYMFQYHPQHEMVKRIIQSNELGNIRQFYGSFCFPPLERSNFRYSPSLGGGALYDAAGYPVRAALSLVSPYLKVTGGSFFVDKSTDVVIRGVGILSGDGCPPAIVSFGFDNFYQCRYEILGTSGKLTAERAYTAKPDQSPRIHIETATGNRFIDVEPANHFVGAFEHFHRSIFDGDVRASLRDEIMTQSMALEDLNRLSVRYFLD